MKKKRKGAFANRFMIGKALPKGIRRESGELSSSTVSESLPRPLQSVPETRSRWVSLFRGGIVKRSKNQRQLSRYRSAVPVIFFVSFSFLPTRAPRAARARSGRAVRAPASTVYTHYRTG